LLAIMNDPNRLSSAALNIGPIDRLTVRLIDRLTVRLIDRPTVRPSDPTV